MVTLVKKIVSILCILLVSNSVTADILTPFEIRAKESSIEYGKSLTINFNLRKSHSNNLSTILKPLKDLFNYEILPLTETDELTKYKIKVYPTTIGDLVIPSLNWNKFKSNPIYIKVEAPSSFNNQAIDVEHNKLKPNPWVREQVKILITITTADKNIILDRKNIPTKGIDSYLVPQTTVPLKHNGSIRYKHTIGWNVFFLYEQKNKLLLPKIEYIKDGVPRYKFHFPAAKFNVKALPIYISPIIPIGHIKIKAKYLELPDLLLQPGSTSIIQYSLLGTGVPAKWLPSLSQKYNVNMRKNIQFSHLKTKLNHTTQNTDLIGMKTVDIAFTPLINGLTPFETLNLQYFDPKLGVLKTKRYIHNKLLVLNWFLQLILFIVIGFLTIYVFIKFKKILKNISIHYIHKYRCKQLLFNATTSVEILRALNEFSASEHWPENLSLYQWLNKFESKYIVTDDIINAFKMLNLDLYSGNNKINTNNIKHKLLSTFNSLKKSPKYINYLMLVRKEV